MERPLIFRTARSPGVIATLRQPTFRYGMNVYGLHFHLEVDEPMIQRWLRVPENREEIARLHGIDPDQIHAETPQHIHRLHELSNCAFGAFVKLFEIEKTRRRLASR
jgi:GMP synthase (glutamine-hydrolysing)